jgi:hypothetical protein
MSNGPRCEPEKARKLTPLDRSNPDFAAGQDAAMRGDKDTTCPHSIGSGTSRTRWMRGYYSIKYPA